MLAVVVPFFSVQGWVESCSCLYFLLFFLYPCGAGGGVVCTKAWRPDAGLQIGRPGASSTIMMLVVGDIPVDSDTFVVTSSIS